MARHSSRKKVTVAKLGHKRKKKIINHFNVDNGAILKTKVNKRNEDQR